MPTKSARIFDIDGTLTNPANKDVINPLFLDYFAAWLTKGEPVVLNSGRSLVWINEKIIPPLREKLKDENFLFENFFAVGEEGTHWESFDTSAHTHTAIDPSFSLPLSLDRKIEALVNRKYS